MKQEALRLAASVKEPAEKQNVLREYMQSCALRSLHESKAFQNLSFVGGTSLRFLFDLPRFSEDLDFSLENADGYEPEIWLAKMKRDFSYLGFETDITWNDRKTVHTAWIKAAGLLMECGLTNRKDQKIAVKIEIDTHPPEGAVMETRIVNRHMLFAVRHHDLPSLMAGKIRALLTRSFQKGRDWYDLVWYLSRIPAVSPNLILLSNALAQPSDSNYFKKDIGWRGSLSSMLDVLDMDVIKEDVGVFLENSQEINLLTVENLRKLL